MNILKYPNKILQERIPEFDFNNTEFDPISLEKEMLGLMLRNNGIGLAANQVGLKVRMFVMGDAENPQQAQAFYNPMVVEHLDQIIELEEGCLSFPGVYVKVKRPTKILARWQNSKGEWQQGELSGYDCVCFLHELDHLEGIIFKDRVSSLKWALAVKKSKKRK
jgi:peptide deformylase